MRRGLAPPEDDPSQGEAPPLASAPRPPGASKLGRWDAVPSSAGFTTSSSCEAYEALNRASAAAASYRTIGLPSYADAARVSASRLSSAACSDTLRTELCDWSDIWCASPPPGPTAESPGPIDETDDAAEEL